MDDNTQLMLALNAHREPERWEEQERGNWDADAMRAEFRERLYADPDHELRDAVSRLLRCRTEGVWAAYAGCDDAGAQNRADRSVVVKAFLDRWTG